MLALRLPVCRGGKRATSNIHISENFLANRLPLIGRIDDPLCPLFYPILKTIREFTLLSFNQFGLVVVSFVPVRNILA
ncbi:hypothetical protein VCHA53P481_30002 [Vibrio chagasii]|nr:hypothetical protein VCHA32O87_20002 [Vibrio chagasii]CAH7052459.1 hypothetical protein VCHA55P509_10328 [Vibrio chagasii]CAH7071198.1 hypothetical protein VCHA54O485_10327 [Vibrio chagasii]CAH7191271.1 hypothetical protein VCHA49P381_20124 [Vibrio chagasii]CAH7265881.1 hypothetical protein VCHA53P481_30002 [Vibrio chagasii]